MVGARVVQRDRLLSTDLHQLLSPSAHGSEGFPRTGHLGPACGTPEVLPDGQNSLDAAAVAAVIQVDSQARKLYVEVFLMVLGSW